MPSSSKRFPGGFRRSILIAGNWKMHKTLEQARSLAGELSSGLPDSAEPQVAIFPPATALAAVAAAVEAARRPILVGAQNMHFEEEGAFTGEISAGMVLEAGGRAVLLGHSERRHLFGESDELVGRKVTRALQAGLTPILCVGETLKERETGQTNAVVSRQLRAGIAGVAGGTELARLIVAYEPVWAIGTGKTAAPSQGQEVHEFIRAELAGSFAARGQPRSRAEETLILYGGSVKPENAAELVHEPDIDGLLVGGASLNAESFLSIVRRAA